MTNEEKAKEIANETLGDFATSFLGMIDEYSEMFCTEAALRAADWKDQQFKEYLEKKKQEYEIERGTLRFSGDVIEEIINGLFNEE